MSLCSNSQSGKLGNAKEETATNSNCNLPNFYKSSVGHAEDEDEEEDVDFNPLLKDSSSAEASSSISFEVEELDEDEDDVDSVCGEAPTFAPNASNVKGDGLDSSTSKEELTGKIEVSTQEHGDIMLENLIDLDYEKRKSGLTPELENGTVTKKNTANAGGAVSCSAFPEEEMNSTSSRMLCNSLDVEDVDAISKRTRARYSLASFSLDELEAFLQETDDEDDLPDIDDEEEYRKFLAAVFNDGSKDGDLATNDHGNDEDEDNDADFELELEEFLESDIIDCMSDLNQKDSSTAAGRRPETRRNKRQLLSKAVKEKVPEFVRKPLRPLVPIFPGATVSGYNGQHPLVQTSQNISSWPNQYSVNAFTPDQMGQLYCLIHEHVQLLIQVYSLSALEPSRKSIASQVQGLLSELLQKRDKALTVRKSPYPSFLFRSPHIYPSVVDEHFKYWPQSEENITGPLQVHDFQSSADLQGCMSSRVQPSKTPSSQVLQGFCWFPYLDGPILSILDVAPLKLVGKYIEGVTTAVQEQMRQYIEPTGDFDPEKQPLFPPLCYPSQAVSNAGIAKGSGTREYGGVPSSLSDHGARKKTLATTIVESTKKQSVALVPKKIAELAIQFYPLLNPALFPHKPPPLSVANRALFTDSEDELLAMGLMEYNTDWKAIQQRFLPCKSKHQIFVRQKNRCSSKAPENPIKAVRRLKTSPLTVEEISRISEGLKMFKLDWMSVWNFIVPYRDPSLLPRQWRVALGTQKSYKKDPGKREKRRLYEWKRRQSKRFASIESAMEKDNEVSADELFLSDSRPAIPSTEPSTSNAYSGRFQRSTLPSDSNMEEPDCSDKGYTNRLGSSFARGNEVSTSRSTGQASPMENFSSAEPSSRSFGYKPIQQPYRSRHPRSSNMVRVAPGLPPVNLPPSVRVISEADFRNPQQRPPFVTENIVSSRQLVNITKNNVHNRGDNTGPNFINLSPASAEQQNNNLSPESARVGRREPSGKTVICSNSAVNELESSNTPPSSTEEKDSTPDRREGHPSMLEIVMEQEELSDSDEEMEHVEFECEEMADSDCEDVDCRPTSPLLNTLDKENQDTEGSNNNTDYSDQLDFPGSGETGGSRSSQLCLRLDGGTPNGIASASDSGKVKGSGGGTILSSQSNKSVREYDNNVIAAQNVCDVPQGNSGEVATSSCRLRRKRVSRHPL